MTTGSSVAYDYYRLVSARADTGLGIGAPRGLRTARAGFACQPPACCTCQRRRAACPGAPPTHGGAPPRTVLCVLATRASLGRSRGCRTDLLRPVAPPRSGRCPPRPRCCPRPRRRPRCCRRRRCRRCSLTTGAPTATAAAETTVHRLSPSSASAPVAGRRGLGVGSGSGFCMARVAARPNPSPDPDPDPDPLTLTRSRSRTLTL